MRDSFSPSPKWTLDEEAERGDQNVIDLPDYYKHTGKYNDDAAWSNTAQPPPTVEERLAQLEQRIVELEGRLP